MMDDKVTTLSLQPQRPIMVVDDEESILLAIDTTLRMAGINNIITCSDSRTVAGILAEQRVEVMLLDLNMPHLHGERLLDEISRDYPEIPVIIVTGAVDVETAVRCVKAGAFDATVLGLNIDRAAHGVHDAGKFDQYTITGGLDDTAVMLSCLGVDEIPAVGLMPLNRPCLVGFHEPRVGNHIGRKNCCELSFHARLSLRKTRTKSRSKI